MGKIVANHDSWAPGARKFASWLAKIVGLEKVIQANVRSSHVKSGTKRQPGVEVKANAVLVTYYSGGKIQRFFCHPVADLSTKGAARRIRKALKQLDERGGVGQSSKVDIAIPEHILHKQRRSEVTQQAVAEPGAPATPEVAIIAVVGAVGDLIIFTSMAAAEAYDILLLKRPPNGTGSFQMTSPQAKLTESFGSFSKAHKATKALTALGLIVKGDRVIGTPNTYNFTVFVRPYMVEPRQRGERSSVAHGAPQRRAKTQPTRKGGSRLADLVQQLEDAHGNVQRLTKLIHDQGFTVSFDKDGKVKLGVK